jgi:hypothetical protein
MVEGRRVSTIFSSNEHFISYLSLGSRTECAYYGHEIFYRMSYAFHSAVGSGSGAEYMRFFVVPQLRASIQPRFREVPNVSSLDTDSRTCFDFGWAS